MTAHKPIFSLFLLSKKISIKTNTNRYFNFVYSTCPYQHPNIDNKNEKNKTYIKLMNPARNPSFMFWICFLIRQEQDCMLAIPKDMWLQTSSQEPKCCNDTMFSILWDEMHLDYQQNNMQLKIRSIQRYLPQKMSQDTNNNYKIFDLLMTGIEK